MLFLFLKGIIAGMVIGAPAGPTGILCLKQNLINRNHKGFFTGFGVATADLIYSGFALFGIGLFLDFLIHERKLIEIFGALILIFAGLYDFFFNEKKIEKKITKTNHSIKSYLFGFFVTIVNPVAILSFMFAFSLMNVANHTLTPLGSFFLILGVFIGSSLTWLLINLFVHKKKIYIEEKLSERIHQISGIVLILFGILFLVKFICF
ncbi:LysE family transporter [archaeon]|nr:LysE family transporter [archaeon]